METNNQTTAVETNDNVQIGVDTNITEQQETTPQVETQTTETKPVEVPNTQDEEVIKETLADKGINFDDLSKEYDEKGELSEETMKKLEKAGFPRQMVEMYVAGLEAKEEAFTQAVYNTAGGKRNFDKVSQFMQQQPKEVIESFNKVLMTGDIGQIGLVVQGVQAQMVAKYGTTNPTIMSGQTASGMKEGFKTRAEVVEAMKDPRYQTDVAYTQEVYRRIQTATYQK